MGTMRNLGLGLLVSVASMMAAPANAQPQRPNIDCIANESAIFKDCYGQQSRTAPMPFNLRSDPSERTSLDREAEG
jgi:hypothetical protein